MHDIFISYSSANRDFALQVVDRLEQFYSVWIDRDGIEGGMQWENTLKQAITDCTVFIIIISPESNASEWVARETILAEKLKKVRIPIMIGGELPFRLLNLHYVDFQGEFEGGFKDLLEALDQHLVVEDKTHTAVNQLLGEAIRAQLSGDMLTARNLIGQALVILPELADSVEAFWESLNRLPQSDYATLLENQLDNTQHLIQHHVRYADATKYEDDRQAFEWFIRIDSTDDILAEIDYVQYELHPTYQSPVRIIRDRKSQFLLHIVGWGTFNIPINIHFKDGSSLSTHTELQFPK